MRAARHAGFDNLSLDLIYGWPGQTIDKWRSDLSRVLSGEIGGSLPEHLSLYGLIVEPGTPMADAVHRGVLSAVDDDAAADFYELAVEMLTETGWLHYEIANWAASTETTSRHNAIYWRNGDYAGIGAGAHGHIGGRRMMNQPSPKRYIALLEQGDFPVTNVEHIDARTAMGETMMLGLRLLQDGVSRAAFEARHGIAIEQQFGSQITRLVSLGLLVADDKMRPSLAARNAACQFRLHRVYLSLSTSPASEIEIYDLALESLFGLIRGERFASRTQSALRKRAVAKLARIRAILSNLGDPHQRYPIVHVTGTSGKGSTAATISAILTAAGYRVGLRTSPYLQVATEKLQIGPSLIDAASFNEIVRGVLAEASRDSNSDISTLPFSYAEAWALMGFLWFAERNVDVAVVEVGAGGRFDATNVIDSIVSVITTVGLDHVVSLGPTVLDIAWHKAGIIKPGSTVVVGHVPDVALAIIAREAEAAGSRLVRTHETDISTMSLPKGWSGFRRQNAEVAAAVVETLRGTGFEIPDAAIAAGVRSMRLPGRLERMPGATRSRGLDRWCTQRR